jgi:hypothetical protein
MKKSSFSVPALVVFAALLSDCLGLQLGGGTRSVKEIPTLGRQLSDLQKARETGAITESEFETQKTKLLESK